MSEELGSQLTVCSRHYELLARNHIPNLQIAENRCLVCWFERANSREAAVGLVAAAAGVVLKDLDLEVEEDG